MKRKMERMENIKNEQNNRNKGRKGRDESRRIEEKRGKTKTENIKMVNTGDEKRTGVNKKGEE